MEIRWNTKHSSLRAHSNRTTVLPTLPIAPECRTFVTQLGHCLHAGLSQQEVAELSLEIYKAAEMQRLLSIATSSSSFFFLSSDVLS